MASIVINLSESTDASSFEVSSFLHPLELRKACDFIEQRLAYLETLHKRNSGGKFIRLNDAVTVLGTRGSGKSSFLYTLCEKYTDYSDVCFLRLIDPTLIEEKGHIFLTILSEIESKVSIKLSQRECEPCSKIAQVKRQWKQQLAKLADGLPSIDGIGQSYEHWQDAEYIMEKGLHSVKSSLNLEWEFSEFLKESLDILGKRLFVLALDDIDIDFRKGWSVLETIRKYLTSPYILVFVSGDLRLFSKAIRKQQWKNFGKGLLINEAEQLKLIKDYDTLVTEMEGQYMQKIMQPVRRLYLMTLKEKLNLSDKAENAEKKLKISVVDNNGPMEIREFYNKCLHKFGINSHEQMSVLVSFLLGLPLRTQIQFMSKIEADDEPEYGVMDVFLNDLYEKRINVDLLRSSYRLLNPLALQLLLKEEKINEGYQLLPITDDGSLNASLTVFTSIFARRAAVYPYLMFDYLIKIGYIQNLMTLISYSRRTSVYYTINSLCEQSMVFGNGNLKNISGRMTAYVRGVLENDKSGNTNNWGGIIKLKGFAVSAKKREAELKDRIDYALQHSSLNPISRCIAYMPVVIAQPSARQQSILNYSIYALMASIGELVEKCNGNTIDEFADTLYQLFQVRAYPMPDYRSALSSNVDETFFTDLSDIDLTDDGVECLYNSLKLDRQTIIPPYLLGKVSARMFYAFRSLELNEPNDVNLGDAMHSRVVILMNSFLVEEFREKEKPIRLNNNNPHDSDKIFIDNLKKILQSDIEDVQISKWICSCPMLRCFLNPDSELYGLLDRFCGGKVPEEIHNLYIVLKNVLPAIQQEKNMDKPAFTSNHKNNNYEYTIDTLENKYTTVENFTSKSPAEVKNDLKDSFRKIDERWIKSLQKKLAEQGKWR